MLILRKLGISVFFFLFQHAYSQVLPQDVDKKKEQRYKSLETFARALYLLETLYVDPTKVEHQDTIHDALQGIVSKLDPHTAVLPEKAFRKMTQDIRSKKFGGIGVMVRQIEGKLIVDSPIEDTPAYKAGIISRDEIVAIDDQKIKDIGPAAAIELMKGDAGSDVKLTIKRAGSTKLLTFTLTRKIIKIKSVNSKVLSEHILLVKVASFQENTADELKSILEEHKDKKGLVLDLRNNPGGLLNQAVRIADFFVESGVLVSTVGRDIEKIEREFAHKAGTFKDIPIIILVNGGSASASEIVAGALQDHERALVLGTQTFGKGSVQTLIHLPDGSGLKLTIARYYTPRDRSIQAKGITPDIVVPSAQAGRDSESKGPKESDLKGHIKGKNLSKSKKKIGMIKNISDWPLQLQNDNQLVTAYTYLKGWNRFN